MGRMFTPTISDIQTALYLASRDNSCVNNYHISTRRTLRSSRALDALAEACISKPHQVFSIGIRLNYSTNSAQIFVASNDDVPHETITHLKKIWRLLRQLASFSRHDKGESEDSRAVSALTNLIDEVLKFSFLKIQSRVLKLRDVLFTETANNAAEEHPIQRFRDLFESFTTPSGCPLPKPAEEDTETWTHIWCCLIDAWQSVDSLLSAEDFCSLSCLRRGALKSLLEKTFSSLAISATLHSAVISSNFAKVLDAEVEFICVPNKPRTTGQFRLSTNSWGIFGDHAIDWYNMTKPTHYPKIKCQWELMHDMNSKLEEAPQGMETRMHCEIKVLHALWRQRCNRASAVSHIGCSKRSCLGCSSFIAAFNERYGTRFETHDTNKAYADWGFPCHQTDLIGAMYTNLLYCWAAYFDGFVMLNEPCHDTWSTMENVQVNATRTENFGE